MTAHWAGLSGLFGAILGSFFATLILRWPQGKSVMAGRSLCDSCGATVRAFDLIPVLSFMFRCGRCRACGGRIAALHPAVEIGCALIGVGAGLLVAGPVALAWTLIGAVLLTLAVLDARHFWLPDALTLPLIAAGLTIGPWMTSATLPDRLIGAALGYGVLAVIAAGYRALRGRDGLGLGDAKLLAAGGAWLGWQALPPLLLAGSLAGLLVALAIRMRGAAIDGTTALPLGTCLIAGLPLALLMMSMLYGAGAG